MKQIDWNKGYVDPSDCMHEWNWFKTTVKPEIPLDQPIREVEKCKDAERIVFYHCSICHAVRAVHFELIE